MDTVKPHGNLLLDERPLVVLPALAVRFGLNEAIALQQLHYWVSPTTGLSTNVIDGMKWAYNTYEEWQAQFPWWSVHTIQRIFTALERRGLVIARAMNVKDWDRRKWYTIDYAVYNQLVSDVLITGADAVLPDNSNLASSKKANNVLEHAKLALSNPSNLVPSNPPKLAPSNPAYRHPLNGTETTAKTTAEPTTETTNDVVVTLEQAGLTHEQAVAAERKHQLSPTEGELWARWKQGMTSGRNPAAVFAGLIKKQRLPPGAGGHIAPAAAGATPGLVMNSALVEFYPSTDSMAHLPAQQVWQAVLTDLAPHVPPDEYETWLKPTTLLDVTVGPRGSRTGSDWG